MPMLRGHVERIDSGGWRIGRLLLVPGRQYADGPRFDPCTTRLVREELVPDAVASRLPAQLVTNYGGVLIRYGRLEHGIGDRGGPGVAALVVAWRDRSIPLWLTSPRYLWRRLQWELRGRPKPQPLSNRDGEAA